MLWIVLYVMSSLAMMALGYLEGLSGSCRSLVMPALVVAFSAVIWLIAELDRPQEGLLRVGQQAMIDLQESMKSPSPPTPS
jgi:hypothetical protein